MSGQDTTTALIKAYCLDVTVGAYLAVVSGSDEQHVALPAAAGAVIKGFTLYGDIAGKYTPIHESGGHAKVQLGGTVAIDDYLMVGGTAGTLIKAAPGTGVNANVVGKALAAGVAGDVIAIEKLNFIMQGA